MSDSIDYDWEILDAEATAKFIAEVRTSEFSALFECSHYELFRKELDFYDGYSLYALSNQMMYPFYEMYYLSNGENHQYLDGTIFPFQALINLDAVALSTGNVEAYLEFYFNNVFDPTRKIHYISDPRNTPYSGARAMGHHFQAIKHHNTREVSFDEGAQCFHVKAPLLYDGATVEGDIYVAENGAIRVEEPVKLSLLDNSIDDAVPSYIHPHETQVIDENKEILRKSAEGLRLLGVLADHKVKLRVVAGIPHCGFALNAREIFIVVPAYQQVGCGYQAIDLATAIREAEHSLMKVQRADPDGDLVAYYQDNYEANLDVLLRLCTIAEECEANGYSEFLDRFRKKGFGNIYSGYKKKINNDDLYELYLDVMEKEG